MIKENELRIGNILNYLTAEEDICPATIDWQDLKWLNEDFKGFNMVHSGIELTQDWLKKLGFEEEVEEILGFKTYDYYLDIGDDLEIYADWHDGKLKCLTISNSEIEIKYLHQLQNLYFALTGDELKLNQH